MIEIPSEYQNKITGKFPEFAGDWLRECGFLLEKYQKKFDLNNLRPVNDLSYNLVFFGESLKYGQIVLKLGLPQNEAIREISAYQLLNKAVMCDCFYSNKSDRVLLLKRLKPAKTLDSLKNQKQKTAVFCEIAAKIKTPELSASLPTYQDILQKAFRKAKNDPSYLFVLEEVKLAEVYYQGIKKLNLARFLLHGDLHHDNILSDKDNWKAIDPHGYYGESGLEAARFMENELNRGPVNSKNIDSIVSLVALNFRENKELLLKFWYIDQVLTTCWDKEENTSAAEIQNDIRIISLLKEMIKD